MTKRVYNGDWPKVRLEILERDGWLCQIKGPKCTTVASDADHIIDVEEDGSWRDRRNLRAVCRSCHNGRKQRRLVVVRAGDVGELWDW